MNAYFVLLLCVFISLLLETLISAYFGLPKKELKRRASGINPTYKRLYSVIKYESSAKALLYFLFYFFAAISVITVSRGFDPFIALVFLMVYALLIKYLWHKQIAFANKIAAAISRYLSKLLYYLHPILELIKDITPKRKKRIKTEIFETEDLQDFIRTQQRAANNKIPQPELSAALSSLEFGSKRIKDFMIPKSKVHFVSPSDSVGPILLSELHKTGFSAFPVKADGESISGVLFLNDLATHKEGGKVEDFMEKKVMYIRQDKPLEDVIQAFSKTGRHEFVTISENAEITGMITLKEVLDQMVGHNLNASFDDYDNPSAVASE